MQMVLPLEKMTTREKLCAIEEIWENLADVPSQIPFASRLDDNQDTPRNRAAKNGYDRDLGCFGLPTRSYENEKPAAVRKNDVIIGLAPAWHLRLTPALKVGQASSLSCGGSALHGQTETGWKPVLLFHFHR